MTDYTDLIARLRACHNVNKGEAADALEAQARRIAELEAALKNFASEAGKYPDLHDTYLVLVPLADLRAARAAYLGENG